ncbi:MAG: tRNA lysidine(34) synthetase TilS [Ignavibacteria bacterium]|nr:tRNA lysidine(34) synthetase TilS [Ignavibacteria bacterium]
MMSPIDSALLDCFTHNNVSRGPLLVAVSGGIDSVTLLHALNRIAHQRNLELHVVHVNHGLRDQDSINDEAFVCELAHALGRSMHVIHANTEQHPDLHRLGIEATARMQRYAALVQTAESIGAEYVCTGHTLNDNVETFIMNAARGSGYKGLSGIPDMRQLTERVRVLRPLLSCTRAQVEDYAHGMGLVWREDYTNSSDEFTRNRVRRNVLPSITASLGENALRGIHASAKHMRDVRLAMDEMLAPFVHTIITVHRNGTATNIDLGQLDALSPKMQKLVLLHGLGYGHDDTMRLLTLLTSEVGSEATLTNGTIALRERGYLVIEPTSTDAFDHVIDLTGDFRAGTSTLHLDIIAPNNLEFSNTTVFFDLAYVQPPLHWRTWKDGDRLTPFGMGGNSSLVSDLITNARILHAERRNMQVLTDARGILWLCGLRRSDRAPVTQETDSVIRCRLITL